MLGKLTALARQQTVGFLALAVAIGGSAYAASDARRAPDPRLHACVKRVGGAMRQVSPRARCARTERRVTWNRQGVRGLRGLAGAPGAPGQTGAPGQNGAPGTPGTPGTPATRLFGEFDANGTADPGIRHRSGVVSAERDGDPGRYRITFSQSVTDCVAVATLLRPTGSSGAPGMIVVGDSFVDPAVKVVETFSSGGAVIDDRDFSVSVFCP